MRFASFAPVTLGLMALLTGAPSWAGATGETFTVGITLSQTPGTGSAPAAPQFPPQSPRPGACYSRALSEETGALVEVACASGLFVSIEALPRAAFLGAHGGAFRYSMSTAADLSVWDAVASDAFGWRTAWGTVTMLRLYDLTWPDGPGDLWWDRPLEMRVSF